MNGPSNIKTLLYEDGGCIGHSSLDAWLYAYSILCLVNLAASYDISKHIRYPQQLDRGSTIVSVEDEMIVVEKQRLSSDVK